MQIRNKSEFRTKTIWSEIWYWITCCLALLKIQLTQ